jgi:hypothetical protein
VLAQDTVSLLAHSEVKLHLHFSLTLVNEVVIAFSPGFPPQCPSHSINYGRLTIAIVTTDASGMDAIKREWWHIIPVAHEITHFQLKRNHLEAPDSHFLFILA